MRVLDDTGRLSDYDYYEYIGFFREYGNKDDHFVFDMKIVPNYSHAYYNEPPGTSIVDQFKQVFYYTHFLLHQRRPDLIPEMIE